MKFTVWGNCATQTLEHGTTSFIASRNGKAIAYFGYTQYSELVEKIVKGSSLLIHEVFCTEQFNEMAKAFGYSTAQEVGKIAQNSEVDKLILSHPLAFVWANSRSLIDEAKSVFLERFHCRKVLMYLNFNFNLERGSIV